MKNFKELELKELKIEEIEKINGGGFWDNVGHEIKEAWLTNVHAKVYEGNQLKHGWTF